MLGPMPLRGPQHTTMARLIVLRTPRQRTVEANTEAANTINLQVLAFVVRIKHYEEKTRSGGA
jgi:hypothetical protein